MTPSFLVFPEYHGMIPGRLLFLYCFISIRDLLIQYLSSGRNITVFTAGRLVFLGEGPNQVITILLKQLCVRHKKKLAFKDPE